MPRYFFHAVHTSRDCDNVGMELPDLNAARKAAVQYTAGLLRDEPELVWDGQDFRVDVTDEDGVSVLIVITMAIDAAVIWPDRDGVRTDPYPLSDR